MRIVTMASTLLASKLCFLNFSPFTFRFHYILGCTRFPRSQSTLTDAENASEYSETPEYPPLFDPSYHGIARKRRQARYDKFKALPTVEEKSAEYCLDKEGKTTPLRRRTVISAFDGHYNTLQFKLFATRTNLKEGLPEVYSKMNVDALAEHIKPIVLNTILDTFEVTTFKRPLDEFERTPVQVLRREDWRRGRMMTDHIVRAVIAVLSSQLPHLRDCQVDYYARCNAFWLAGGFGPPKYIRQLRRRITIGAVTPVDAPADVELQYNGKPYMQLRNTQPLPPFVDRDDSMCTTYDGPEYNYQTNCTGLRHPYIHPTNLPGFWPGDPYGFGSLAVYTTEILRTYADMFGEDCCKDMLHGCGVVSSFGWLMALAHLKGFTVYQELTYPLATQTVLTNGKHWSFYTYQLNAMCLHADLYTKQYQNVCWTTNGMKLFDTVENGRVVGYNDEVVKLLIKFLVYAPQEREGVNLTPYLQHVEHADDDIMWSKLCYRYKRCCASRGFKIPYGPRQWETIYKGKFHTRLE